MRPYLVQAVLALLLVVLVFPGVFLRGDVAIPGELLYGLAPWSNHVPESAEPYRIRLMLDIVTAMYPYYTLKHMLLSDGAWPLWNPLQYAGMPLAANCQSVVFYPPGLLHVLFDPLTGATLYTLFKIWLCGMTAFAYGRKIGLRLGADHFLGVAWMLSAYNLIWAQWPLPDVSAWLPIVLLGVEYALAGRVVGGVAAFASGGALLILAGHPETAFAMTLGAAVYGAVRALLLANDPRRILRAVGIAVVGWVIALALCAVQLFLIVEYLAHSYDFYHRPTDRYDVRLLPDELAALFVPNFFGNYYYSDFYGEMDSNFAGMIYPGLAVLAGIALLLLPGQVRRRYRHHLLAYGFTAVLFTLLSWRLDSLEFFHRLPVVSSMHRAYFFSFTAFALPVLGALGWQHFLSEPRRGRSLWPLLALAAAAAALLAWSWWYWSGLMAAAGARERVLVELAIAVFFAGAVFALAAAAIRWPRPALMMMAAVLLLAADALHAQRWQNPTAPRSLCYAETPLITYLRRETGPQARMSMSYAGIPPGVLTPFGIADWLAYDGLYPLRMRQFQEKLGKGVWGSVEPICGITHFLHNPELPPEFPLEEHPEWFALETTLDGVAVYANRRVLPRAFLVPSVREVPTLDDVYPALLEETFDPQREVIVETGWDAELPAAATPLEGGVTITDHGAQRATMVVEANQPAALVVSETFFPGWRAIIDGEPAALFPAYGVFRGLRVPAGRHTVEIVYQPLTLTLGVGVSTAAALLMLAAVPWAWPRRAAQRAGASRARSA